MKRVIEIIAKSQEEVRELARQELRKGERIVAENILYAPTRGIFGIVGNPEYKMSFTLEQAPVEEAPSEEELNELPEETSSTDSVAAIDKDTPFSAAMAKMDKEDGETVPSTPVDFKVHPEYAAVHKIIKQTAEIFEISDLEISEKSENGYWIIDMKHAQLAQLIGKHGKTIDSLQYLLNIIANKGHDAGRVRILLDGQGYRDQRYKGLIILANRMYRKALDSKQPVELEPMSTIDRRTIHLTLKDRPGIETFSRGVEPLRRVIISPRKAHYGHGNSSSHAGSGQGSSHYRPARPANSAQRPQGAPKAVPVFMEDDNGED
ncbi:MAG: KH domain-containing protein [Candidatus Riflebacteria bacterium]|nr:KH domain-containing protein [Candidatus Riflebacteria bacterium]